MFKRSIVGILVVVLSGCGSPANVPVNPPAPPPASVDLVKLLFSTPCRDIGGGTTVCDKMEGPRIRRTTYTIGNHFGLNGEEIHTDSIYAIRSEVGCISVAQEETRIHSTGSLHALQIYSDDQNNPPCWINKLSTLADGNTLDSGSHEFNWTWTHYDTNGVQIGDAAHGRVSDRTLLTITGSSATLIERYEDLADVTSIYCGVGSYSMPALGGMISVRQDQTACK